MGQNSKKNKVMKRQTCFLAVIISAFLMAGCSTSWTTKSRSDLVSSIHRGMTMQQVMDEMGKPKFRSFVGDREEWRYEKFKMVTGHTTIIIGFSDGKVEYMDSFEGVLPQEVLPGQTPVVVLPSDGWQYPEGEGYYSFEGLIARLKKTTLKSERYNIVKEAARRNRFTSEQCAEILKTLAWDDERLEVLPLLVPIISDRYNDSKIVQAMTFISGEKEARAILNAYRGRSYCSFAMTDADFSDFYRQMKEEPFKDGQLKLIRNKAVSSGFSCNQCVKILELLTWDDDKMEFLSVLAPVIVDRSNSDKIVKCFTYMSGREKARRILEAYK